MLLFSTNFNEIRNLTALETFKTTFGLFDDNLSAFILVYSQYEHIKA